MTAAPSRVAAGRHRLVFRGFGLADNARGGAKVLVKLSGIGRVPDGRAKPTAARMLRELRPKPLLWGSEWPHMMATHAHAPSYAQTLHWLEGLVPDEGAERGSRRDACRSLPTSMIQGLYSCRNDQVSIVHRSAVSPLKAISLGNRQIEAGP